MTQAPATPIEAQSPAVEAFLTRWKGSGRSERASFQPYMSELCRLLDVPEPNAPTTTDQANASVFQKYIWTGRHQQPRRLHSPPTETR